MTRLRAELGDITTYDVDAVVNAANSSLLGGGGVDGAIHRAGGPAILDECRAIVARIGRLPTGDAVITGGGNMPCRHVIHTVGPIWDRQPTDESDRLLASAYSRSLRLAEHEGCASIAFPNISTGVYGFPKPRAARVAIDAVRRFVDGTPAIEAVVFVCFDDENLALYRALLDARGQSMAAES